MEKKPLIGVSIIIVVVLVLASLSTVVGYQTVESSHQNLINEKINQKELLFQTIVDIANNKEIQGILLRHQISQVILPDAPIPILTMKQLKQMYVVGVILSKLISKSAIQSMIQKHQSITSDVQHEINIVIQKDATLNKEMKQLSELGCGCENENTTSDIPYFICRLFIPLVIYYIFCWYVAGYDPPLLFLLLDTIDKMFNCWWGWNP